MISDRIFPTKSMKCVIIPIYRLPKQNMCYFLDVLSEKLDFYSEHYANIYILGDFSSTPSNPRLTLFFFFNFYSDFINIIHKKKFILNKHKSQLKFLYKNATLCIFIRTLPPTQNELIERKTIACVWELRHFSFFF